MKRRRRDAKGHFLPGGAKAAKPRKRRAKAGAKRRKSPAKGLSVRRASSVKGQSLAQRVHRLEVGQREVKGVIVQIANRVVRIEHAVNHLAKGLAERFGSGAAVRQLGSGR